MDNVKPGELPKPANPLKAKWWPWVRADIVNDQLHYAILESGQWQPCQPEQIPAFSVFAKLTLRLPTSVCAYRIRSFPQHMLSLKELNEAIVLDFPKWSPWGKDSGYCYTHTAVDNEWRVAIWVWDQQYADKYLQLLPYCTHVMPQLAWIAAALPAQSALVVCGEDKGLGYLLLDDLGKPLSFTSATSPEQAFRSWHGWGVPDVKQGWTINAPSGYWQPENLAMQPVQDQQLIPHTSLLRSTRISGVRDWTDPAAYTGVFKALTVILFSWMAADAAVLTWQSGQIQRLHQGVHQSADRVLTLRDNVETTQTFLQQARQLQHQQRMPEHMIAQLTKQIPGDIYLKSLAIEGDQLDIEGQGKQVARLMVLLESLPDVAKVMLINDIRRNSDTDEELFQIRLLLKPYETTTP